MKLYFLAYLGGLLLFGSNGIVASGIELPSSQLVLLRTAIGCLLLFALFALRHRATSPFASRRDVLFIAVSGVAMGAAWLFLYEAYDRIGVGTTTLLFYCGPVIVMAVSPLVFRTKLTVPMLVGFAVVIAGMLLVNGRSIGSGQSSWGLFCAGMSAVMYAVMIVFNKQASQVKGLANATVQLAATLLTVAAFVGATSGFAIDVRPQDWPAALFLGLANTGLGTLLYFAAIGNLPVQTVSICGYLEPLFAVVLSALVLGEAMSPLQLLGAACIIGGAVIGEWASSKPAKDEAAKQSERPAPPEEKRPF